MTPYNLVEVYGLFTGSSATSVSVIQTVRWHVPEYSNIYGHRRENLLSQLNQQCQHQLALLTAEQNSAIILDTVHQFFFVQTRGSQKEYQ
jgi:UDP-N-acetylglucosamine 2-epimerase